MPELGLVVLLLAVEDWATLDEGADVDETTLVEDRVEVEDATVEDVVAALLLVLEAEVEAWTVVED